MGCVLAIVSIIVEQNNAETSVKAKVNYFIGVVE